MVRKRTAVIQLPEWDGWRIAGGENDWQIQRSRQRGGEEIWEGTNFFTCLEHAVGFAYEKALRESGLAASDFKQALDECARTKSSLLKAVRKAVAG